MDPEYGAHRDLWPHNVSLCTCFKIGISHRGSASRGEYGISDYGTAPYYILHAPLYRNDIHQCSQISCHANVQVREVPPLLHNARNDTTIKVKN